MGEVGTARGRCIPDLDLLCCLDLGVLSLAVALNELGMSRLKVKVWVVDVLAGKGLKVLRLPLQCQVAGKGPALLVERVQNRLRGIKESGGFRTSQERREGKDAKGMEEQRRKPGYCDNKGMMVRVLVVLYSPKGR